MTLEKIVLDHPDFTPPPLPLSSSTTAPPTPPAPPARISPSPAASWVLVLSKWCQLIAQQPLRAWQLGRPRTLLHLNQRGFKGGVTSINVISYSVPLAFLSTHAANCTSKIRYKLLQFMIWKWYHKSPTYWITHCVTLLRLYWCDSGLLYYNVMMIIII